MKKKIYITLVLLAVIIFGFAIQRPNKAMDAGEAEYQHIIDAPPPPPADDLEQILSPFDSIISCDFEKSGSIGTAIVVTYKGRIAYMKCLGTRKEGENAPVDQHTVFRLASVSKSVTGVLATILDTEGSVSLEDKVVDYLPDFALKNPQYTEQLRIKNLLSQSTGVVPHAYDLMVEDQWPLEKIIPYLKDAAITAAPGQVYTYQNVLYSVYEPIIESKLHQDFQELMSEKVFKPFGMNDASLNFEAFYENSNKAYPHTPISRTRYCCLPLNDRYYNTAPAAGVNASITDLGNLLIGLSHKPDVFPPQARQKAFTPQIHTPLKHRYFSSWGNDVHNKSYGIGWRIVDYKGQRIAYHGGYVKGYKAEIALCDEEDIGIAILSNSPNNISSKWIPTLFNMYFESPSYTLANKAEADLEQNEG